MNFEATRPGVLTLNGGSSSIRFAFYELGAPRPLLAGRIDRIGLSGTNLVVVNAAGKRGAPRRVAASGHRAAANFLLPWLEQQTFFPSISAVGHRVVHGMNHAAPERITPILLAELRRLKPSDPDHLPGEIELIQAFRRRHPKLPQVACFDTAFHRTMPRVAKLLPIPRRYARQGVERYGFHGLSYAYLLEELARLGDPVGKKGRVILAHLGNGASLAAVRDGKSVDTSMGFTPAAGLVMSTRSGDLDPGLLFYLSRRERLTPAAFNRMVNHESGLLGLSGTSSDMRDLCAREAKDVRARDAVTLFCYQAKKWIGAYAAALGGVDAIVFAGGIGENAPLIRTRICTGLGFLGVTLDKKRNARNAPLISSEASRVRVRVIPTNEELMIARSVTRVLKLATSRRNQS
ncbi:MAG: acetate/propionate family kinase [Opitutus sp.]